MVRYGREGDERSFGLTWNRFPHRTASTFDMGFGGYSRCCPSIHQLLYINPFTMDSLWIVPFRLQ